MMQSIPITEIFIAKDVPPKSDSCQNPELSLSPHKKAGMALFLGIEHRSMQRWVRFLPHRCSAARRFTLNDKDVSAGCATTAIKLVSSTPRAMPVNQIRQNRPTIAQRFNAGLALHFLFKESLQGRQKLRL
jgi:hypothetical protein